MELEDVGQPERATMGASITDNAIGGFETGILTDVRGCQDGRGRPPGALLMDASQPDPDRARCCAS